VRKQPLDWEIEVTLARMDSTKQTDVAAMPLTPEERAGDVEADEREDALAEPVLRKIDWRLIPLMFITYNLNFMDKTILSSASVFGLREDTVRISPSRSSPLPS